MTCSGSGLVKLAAINDVLLAPIHEAYPTAASTLTFSRLRVYSDHIMLQYTCGGYFALAYTPGVEECWASAGMTASQQGERSQVITLKTTERGFSRGEFVDRYGEKCSIQKSSLAGEDCIWLGCEHETIAEDGTRCGARMHLTQAMAVDIVMYLQRFIETGELS